MPSAFWGILALLAMARMALAWNESVTVVLGPHDDSLYVSRALSLLSGEGFGPYTSATLLKYPGLSMWLAGGAYLGLPYLGVLNLLYVAAGFYLCVVMCGAGVPRIAVAAGYVLFLFNPFTFDVGWTRMLREPLATVFLITVFASLVGLMNSIWRGRLWSPHLGVFAASLAFASLLREEDVLLMLIPAAAGAIFGWVGPGDARPRWARVALVAAVPLMAAALAHGAAGAFIERHYGASLLHDFGGGEYPRMIAAMRSVKSRRDNRFVMISQETLAALRKEVPRLEPVIRRLPQPSRATVSCEWVGVCTEWANGWLPFWIKDAAYDAGLTSDLPSGQAYFRAVREDIAQACSSGRLACAAKGSGLIPPFEIRWTRALLQEAGRLLSMLVLPHGSDRQVPTSVHGPGLDRMFAAVTGSPVKAAPASVPPREQGSFSGFLRSGYGWIAFAMIAAMAAACLHALWTRADLPRGPLAVAAGALVAYIGVRLVALSYIAITMGRYDPRMVMSSHILLVFISPCIIAFALHWLREKKQ